MYVSHYIPAARPHLHEGLNLKLYAIGWIIVGSILLFYFSRKTLSTYSKKGKHLDNSSIHIRNIIIAIFSLAIFLPIFFFLGKSLNPW